MVFKELNYFFPGSSYKNMQHATRTGFFSGGLEGSRYNGIFFKKNPEEILEITDQLA